MIVLGIVLVVLGYFIPMTILMTIGIILIVLGVIFWVLGSTGRAIGGRKYWY